jgi:hypothetical protein
MGRVDFVTAMSGKDDAVDKEIERLLAKERAEFRFSNRSYLFVLGSGDRDFAQSVRECSADGIPVMVLATKGGIAEAYRSNFDFSDDSWKELMRSCSAGGGGTNDGDLKRKRAIESDVAITTLQAADAWGVERSKLNRCITTTTPGACSSTTSASSTPAAAAFAALCAFPRTADEWRREMVKVDAGADRERTLLEMESAGVVSDEYILALVLSGYFAKLLSLLLTRK